MKGFAKCALVIALLLGCSAVTSGRHSVIYNAQEQTVYITADVTVSNAMLGSETDLNSPMCGGFLYRESHGEELIVTARHCLEDQEEADLFGMTYIHIVPKEVHFINGDVAKIQRTYTSNYYDVGVVLAHSFRSHYTHATYNDNIKTGDPLFVMGMPAGHLWTYSSATVSNDETLVNDAPAPWSGASIFIECVSCYQGDSGSAVFDQDGNIIGIVNATTDVNNLFLITPASIVRHATNVIIQQLPDIYQASY